MAKPRLVQEKTVTREDKKVNNSNITIYVNFKTRNRKMKVFYFLFGDVSFKILNGIADFLKNVFTATIITCP